MIVNLRVQYDTTYILPTLENKNNRLGVQQSRNNRKNIMSFLFFRTVRV